VLLEKEPGCGAHASGRNSGVLHAGFYYTADSFKARFCRDGNRALTAWCEEKGLPLRRTGKLVVARSAADLPGLDELGRRAVANGVACEMLAAADARRIEPRVHTFERALWSPSTSTVDALRVVRSLEEEAERLGVDVRAGVAWRKRSGSRSSTSFGEIEAGFLVNAAGLYADRIAWAYGFGEGREIVPFKGSYLYAEPAFGSLATCVYPVPDLQMPFLGVHWTVDVEGRVKIGPTALPAAWREQYRGLSRFSARELLSAARVDGGQLVRDSSFRRLAVEELGKATRRGLVARARALIEGAEVGMFRHYGRAGIRAQLFDRRTRQLVMDFAVEGDDRSLHVLNAVSPAFTCSFPFASWLVDQTPLR
jgi:L-2-hydroxyglutarate oxidase LhgO